MSEESKSGIIGFFDILGYRSFLKNNKPEEAAREVLKMLSQVGNHISEIVAEMFPIFKEKKAMENISWLVFSDTVLIVSTKKQEPRLWQWLVFLLCCSELQRHMFLFGLPLRGAICTGEFMVEGSCFVGQPIVEAYGLSQDIDIAATIFSPEAHHKLKAVVDTFQEKNSQSNVSKIFEAWVIEYLIPNTSKDPKKYFTLNPFLVNPLEKDGDVAQIVLESFWKHNKDIPLDAAKKAENTEQFIRFLKYKHPEFFKRSDK